MASMARYIRLSVCRKSNYICMLLYDIRESTQNHSITIYGAKSWKTFFIFWKIAYSCLWEGNRVPFSCKLFGLISKTICNLNWNLCIRFVIQIPSCWKNIFSRLSITEAKVELLWISSDFSWPHSNTRYEIHCKL